MHALWDELVRFPAAEIDAACHHLMLTMAGWLRADVAAWFGTARLRRGGQVLRDPLLGWRMRSLMLLDPVGEKEAALVNSLFTDRRQEFGLTTIAIMKGAGSFRVHRLRDGFVDFAALEKTGYYQSYYRDFGLDDRLWVASPLTAEAESFFLFDRRHTRARFTAADARLAGDTLRGLLWFQRQLMCSHGLSLVESPLTAMERRVLGLLLTDRTEKEIAAELGQSEHTTHDHIKHIYRKFGARGRAGLMAIWLAHG